MRAVLDPNVLISGLLSLDGPPAKILRRWDLGEFELVVSPSLLSELTRALAYRKIRARLEPSRADEFVELLRGSAILAADLAALPRSADAEDDYLIRLAETQRAVLVSGDKHLTDLAESFLIESPAAFLRRLEAQA